MEEFKKMLMQYKCVSVEFPPSSPGNHSASLKYHMDDYGNIIELYDYNKTAYFICNINNERAFCDNFYCIKDAAKIAPSTTNIGIGKKHKNT